MTDRELADLAWAELVKTVESYATWRKRGFPASSHWAHAKDYLDQIGVTLPTPPPPGGRIAGMETGDFSEFDSINSGTPGTLVIDATRAYEGSRSAHASTPGNSANKYARGIFDVDWKEGTDVWYGAAFYLPSTFFAQAKGWIDILRWDNWTLTQSTQDQGGLALTPEGRLLLLRKNPPSGDQEILIDVPAPSLGAWHWLEVHQRFSQSDGSAVSSLWVDSVVAGAKDSRNIYSRPITALRVGIVSTNDPIQTTQLDLWFDRVSITASQLGPVA